MNVLLFCLLSAAMSVANDGASRPAPPGPYVRPVDLEALRRTAFAKEQPIVGTYYFYWYDLESGAHFVNADGSDALTRHPAMVDGTSYLRSSWHHRELEDTAAAGIDFILPVYWGYPGDYENWSFAGLPPLVEAARQLEKEGKRPARIGCFYDTSTLQHNRPGYHADLRTTGGKEWLYMTVRDFFSLIPPDLWATIQGRPILWLYSASFASHQDPVALDYLRREFRADFGVVPYIVKEISWRGTADATYAWGAALRANLHDVAALGPGYDHAAVPGRTPLVREREGGAFYRRSWEWVLRRSLSRRPTIAVVETWNEWHEGTDIAPSRESGRYYVDMTRKYADLWHGRSVLKVSGPLTGRSDVSIVLGSTNKEEGIRQDERPDGVSRAVDIQGVPARATVRTENGGRFLYFDVDDSFYWCDDLPLSVEVTFLDEGVAVVGLDYDSTDVSALHSGAFKPAASFAKTGTGRWRTVCIRLEDAAFTGRANGNDFRLVDHDGKLVVRRVVVRKELARSRCSGSR